MAHASQRLRCAGFLPQAEQESEEGCDAGAEESQDGAVGCAQPSCAHGEAPRSIAALWRRCREAESAFKRLEWEMKAEQEAWACERAILLAQTRNAAKADDDADDASFGQASLLETLSVLQDQHGAGDTHTPATGARKLESLGDAGETLMLSPSPEKLASSLPPSGGTYQPSAGAEARAALHQAIDAMTKVRRQCAAQNAAIGIAEEETRRALEQLHALLSTLDGGHQHLQSEMAYMLSGTTAHTFQGMQEVPSLPNGTPQKTFDWSGSEESPTWSPNTSQVNRCFGQPGCDDGPGSGPAEWLFKADATPQPCHTSGCSQASSPLTPPRPPRGARQPFRRKVALDGVHALPEFVTSHLRIARARNAGGSA